MSFIVSLKLLFFVTKSPKYFSKVLGQHDQLQKIPLGKMMKGQWSQNLQFWLRNCLELPHDFFFDLLVFANLPAGHSGGVSRGRVHGCGCLC